MVVLVNSSDLQPVGLLLPVLCPCLLKGSTCFSRLKYQSSFQLWGSAEPPSTRLAPFNFSTSITGGEIYKIGLGCDHFDKVNAYLLYHLLLLNVNWCSRPHPVINLYVMYTCVPLELYKCFCLFVFQLESSIARS